MGVARPAADGAPDEVIKRRALFEASLLYAVGDLHQLAHQAPPDKAEVIRAVADFLAGLTTSGD